MLVALVTCLRGSTWLPLSVDEYYSLNAITRGLDQHLWELPLIPYYGLLWVWTFGGNVSGDLWMRGLSVAAIVGTAGLVAASARRLAGPRAGYLGGIGIALVPSMQELSHLARPYAVGTALAASSTYVLVRLVVSPAPARPAWISYGSVLALMVIVMPQSAVIVIAHCIFLVYSRTSRGLLRSWFFSLIIVIPVVVSGLFLLALGTYSSMHAWLPPPALDQVPNAILRVADAAGRPSTAAAAFGFALVVIGLMSSKGTGWILGASGAALMIWVVSQMGTSFWLAGSFGPLVPLVVLGAATSLSAISSWQQVLIIGAMLMVAIPAYQGVRQERTGEADSRAVASILEENVERSSVLFGDPTDAYSLRAMVNRYGASGINWTETRAPTDVYWSLYEDDRCMPITSWDVRGGGVLKLCER